MEANEEENMKSSWNAPPTHLPLSKEEVHVWRAALDLPSRRVEEFKGSLSIDERMRVERFRFERDKSRFIAAHGILRLILSSYLNVEPHEIQFCDKKDGKPRLQNGFGKTDIQFNLSHSEGLALYGFTRGHKVGIDVEYLREIPEMEQIVERFFSIRERAFFDRLHESEKQETFFNWWTRKEAIIKAIGNGLYHPLDYFDVSLAGNKKVRLVGMEGNSKIESEWLIQGLRPAPGFLGAFAVESRRWKVHYWLWADH